jgi:AraC-like DNA-binding protein
MGLRTTALQFGYFLGLLFAILFWIRGIREERLSDKLLGFVMFFLAMEIQDYTFGFAGINYLWTTLDGYPRHFPWIFPASVYFYLQAQTNRDFRLNPKHLWHISPYLLYVVVSFILLALGHDGRYAFYNTIVGKVFYYLEYLTVWIPIFYYFIKSIKFYQHYKSWTVTQFSDTELVSFIWLRNFIYVFIIGYSLKLCFSITDAIVDLPYEQDYYWQLFIVIMIIYVGIMGYSQIQPKKLIFNENIVIEDSNSEIIKIEAQADLSEWKPKIEKLFIEDKIFLEPELSLSDLAQKLKTNTSILSAAINQNFNKNFNDFVNEFRVEEFRNQIKMPQNKHLTLLAVAFDCGFNSKATFNRAVKKATGLSPKEV